MKGSAWLLFCLLVFSVFWVFSFGWFLCRNIFKSTVSVGIKPKPVSVGIKPYQIIHESASLGAGTAVVAHRCPVTGGRHCELPVRHAPPYSVSVRVTRCSDHPRVMWPVDVQAKKAWVVILMVNAGESALLFLKIMTSHAFSWWPGGIPVCTPLRGLRSGQLCVHGDVVCPSVPRCLRRVLHPGWALRLGWLWVGGCEVG